MKHDLEIAQEAALLPIGEVAEKLGLVPEEISLHGSHKAKIHLDVFDSRRAQPDGKLVLCTAITPTPAGEGKTTTTVGLSMALNRLGKSAVAALREPSLGPVFGVKGGAAGGGYSQVLPMEDINLHFTGDLHAVAASHNLLGAMIDNHLFHGNDLDINPEDISWPRVLDVNDRALRNITISQGGDGPERRTRFDITAASEVMAILCLSLDVEDLKARLDRVIVASTRFGRKVTAQDVRASGAMAVLLKDALQPNLVQTIENTPAIVHGGPFANIAHGCNSAMATRMGLRLADYCVTEAGFGADLGAEKFFDIKCRSAGLKPDCVVLVATVRALKYHGGQALERVGEQDLEALRKGMANLKKHLENLGLFGVPCVVAINPFASDSEAELALLKEEASAYGVPVVVSDVFARGGEGGLELGAEVVRICDNGAGTSAPEETDGGFRYLYDLGLSLREKVEIIATQIYGAEGVDYVYDARTAMERFERIGYGILPICMAKTQYSFTDDPAKRGRPQGFRLTVREVRLSAGARMIVPVCGKMTTMPGLPARPAAERIDLLDHGIVGLF